MAEKDYEKAQRLNEVYKYLFAHDKVKSQTDFADKLKVQRTGLSAAMNGSKANLTKNLFMKICATFPNLFNIEYLLIGTGDLLAVKDEIHNVEVKKEAAPPADEMTANILEMYAQRVRLVDDLRETLKNELEDIRAIRSELQQARDDFRDATYRMTQCIRNLSENGRNTVHLDMAAEDINAH